MSQSNSVDGKTGILVIFLVLVFVIVAILIVVVFAVNRSTSSESTKSKSADYPSVAENMSSDPNIVEISITASDNEVHVVGEGSATKLYNYNKSFPGPLIEAKVGDQLIVHFFNDISEPSTITWHGLDVDSNMDGSLISQLPVMPGDSFEYNFCLQDAGLFWYHSDINPREQVHKGLYGVILVRDYEEDDELGLPTSEHILAFSDLKLGEDNQVDIDYSNDPSVRASEQINGIDGNVLLTNGVHNGFICVTKNEPHRLRMVNTATDRFMKISIENHDMLRIGGDGGLIEKPILIKSENGLMLTPGERADIVFVPNSDEIKIYTLGDPKGKQHVVMDDDGYCVLVDTITPDNEKQLLVTLKASGDSSEKLMVQLKLKNIKKIYTDHCTPVIPVTFGHYQPEEQGNVEFFAQTIDKEGVSFDCLTPKDAPVVFEDGTYIIEVTNWSNMANNFHLHGFKFQHIDTVYISNGDKDIIYNKITENKDTIFIPPRPHGYNAKTVVRLAVEFKDKCRDIIAYGKYPTDYRSGGWIFQSHMLTHAELGQQGFIQIVAECDRMKYNSYSGYLNSYSNYSSGNRSVCLTKSSMPSYNFASTTKSYSSSSYSNSKSSYDDLSKSSYSKSSHDDSLSKSSYFKSWEDDKISTEINGINKSTSECTHDPNECSCVCSEFD